MLIIHQKQLFKKIFSYTERPSYAPPPAPAPTTVSIPQHASHPLKCPPPPHHPNLEALRSLWTHLGR